MVCSPFSSLLLSQQFTNLAAVFAHCCLSPSGNGSFSSLVIGSQRTSLVIVRTSLVIVLEINSGSKEQARSYRFK